MPVLHPPDMSFFDRSSPRRNRYARSSTTSVTRLLSDSCSSLIQRLTTRVRGPSQSLESTLRIRNRISDKHADTPTRQRLEATYERKKPLEYEKRHQTESLKLRPRVAEDGPKEKSKKDDEPKQRYKESESRNARARLIEDTYTQLLGSTRTRLEDKYSDVLDKYAKRKKNLQRAESPPPEPKPGIMKSATTSAVVLTEKAYPFVTSPVLGSREKTPFGSRILTRRREEPEPHPTYRRSGPLRTERSETIVGPYLKLCTIDIDAEPEKTPTKPVAKPNETSGVDEAISEREARRKEIQSLINKYVMLDEAYNKLEKAKEAKTKDLTKRTAPGAPASKRTQVAGVSRWCGVCPHDILLLIIPKSSAVTAAGMG